MRLGGAMCKRFPNVKTFELEYDECPCEYMIHNLSQLQKLETFHVSLMDFDPKLCCREDGHYCILHDVVLPHSLGTVCLRGTRCYWDEEMSVIGSLPNLEALCLGQNSFTGRKWNPLEGEFLKLKGLCMIWIEDLVYWNVDCTHFPVLQHLLLDELPKLRKIPLDIGEIPTLERIRLDNCSADVETSGKRILHQQRSSGNHKLTLRINGYM